MLRSLKGHIIYAMTTKKYLLLLVDRQHAKLFIIADGRIIEEKKVEKDNVPQNVKHGDDTWDAQDKIFRHIEQHLHRHLHHVAVEATTFIKEKNVTGILIGGHKPLFAKVESHLQYPFSKKVFGTFVTELKVPNNIILHRALQELEKIETKKEDDRLQQALH